MRSAALYYAGCEGYQNQTNFLEACFLCHKPLGHNCDIYMYRGNTPFCSQECRQEQIEIDESKEKRWKLKTSSSSSKRSSTPDSTTTTTKTGPTNNDVRTGTLVVA